jgi:hypothetical protein
MSKFSHVTVANKIPRPSIAESYLVKMSSHARQEPLS